MIELKKVKLTKSIINQLQYIGTLPKNDNYTVLGYVIIPKKASKVIIQTDEGLYYCNNISKIETILKSTQFANPDLSVGGYVYPERINIKIWTFEGRPISFSPNYNEEENLKLLDKIKTYIQKIKEAGQIYY